MLDPKVAELIQRASRVHKSYDSIGVAGARNFYDKASRALELPETPLAAVSDLSLELPGRTLTIRRYSPVETSWFSKEPGLLFFHGGGFTIGSIFTHDYVCRALAAHSGVQVFSVEYRLAPEHPFPAAVDDAFAALEWFFANAEDLGLDSGRLGVAGDSAGGTLAAACAIHARDLSLPLAFQCLIYPGLSSHQDTPSHKRLAKGVLMDDDTIQWFFKQYLPRAEDRNDWRFSPLKAKNLAGLAPAYICSAEYDPLVDEDAQYAAMLNDAGVKCIYKQFDGLIHAFLHHVGFVPVAQAARLEIAHAIRDGLL